jgi:hypothetical protein
MIGSMTRTEKRQPYNVFSKEKKMWRKPLLRVWRHRAKQALHVGDEPERERKTSGWLTW